MDPFTMALLGGGGSLLGGLFSSRASQQASQQQSMAAMMSAQIQAQEAAAARAQQERMYQESVARMEPFRQGGVAATNRMQELYGIGGQPKAPGYGSYARPFGMADYQADPGYNFRVREGQKALDQSASAGGLLQSGSALKAATRYGQEMGSQEYGNAYNRFLQQRELQLRGLQGLASPGSTVAAQTGQLGVQTGQNIANTMMQGAQAMGQGIENAGAARASGYMGRASALSGALNAIPQNYMMYSMLNRYAPATGGGAPLGGLFGSPFPSSYNTSMYGR